MNVDSLDTLIMRPAVWADREQLTQMLGQAFASPRAGVDFLDFAAMHPHLFHERRIGDHLLALEDERIVGAAGVYGYDVKLDGVTLRGAAVGQVATVSDRRGRGVMNAMLADVTRMIDERGYDFSWLVGDLRVFGAHGWGLGGTTVQYELARNDLPGSPDPSLVQTMWPAEIVATIVRHRETTPTAVLMAEDELELMVEAHRHVGLRLGDAWLIHNIQANAVSLADGPIEDIARLVAHLLSSTVRDELVAICANEATALSRFCTRYGSTYQTRPSCLWRVCKLEAMLSAAASMARARISDGDDTLSLMNTDTGEVATLTCRGGRLSVHAGAEATPLAFDTSQLSTMVFGGVFGGGLLDHFLPALRPDSPLRRVLPTRASYNHLYRF